MKFLESYPIQLCPLRRKPPNNDRLDLHILPSRVEKPPTSDQRAITTSKKHSRVKDTQEVAYSLRSRIQIEHHDNLRPPSLCSCHEKRKAMPHACPPIRTIVLRPEMQRMITRPRSDNFIDVMYVNACRNARLPPLHHR